MRDLREFVFFAAAVLVVVSALVCAVCAVTALLFYAEDRRAHRRRLRRRPRPLSPHVPLEPMRRSTFGPLDVVDPATTSGWTELDRRRAQREARDAELPGC